jgi:hypothetical protein
MEKITSKESPISKRLRQSPTDKNVVSFSRSEIRELSGLNTGLSTLIFKFNRNNVVHFYGVFNNPDEIMNKFPGNWIYEKESRDNLLGKSPDECYKMEHDNGEYLILRYV